MYAMGFATGIRPQAAVDSDYALSAKLSSSHLMLDLEAHRGR